MDDHQKKPGATVPNSSAAQTTPVAVVTCQARASQMAPTFVSPSTGGYVLTASNLRPVGNYTLVAGSQAPATAQYVVQSAARAAVPGQQFVTAAGVRHVLSASSSSSSSQPSNVTYVLPSGAHIVRMSGVMTTAAAGDPQRPAATQYILTSGSPKLNSTVLSSLGAQSALKTVAIATAAENGAISSGGITVSRNLGVTTTTSTILQRTGIQIPRLNTAYYSQVKGTEPPKISFRPKLSEPKAGTSYILTSNDWSRAKNVPISSLQKVNANYMQIPLVQKPGTVLSANTVKSNVDIQQQPIRSVYLPSNYRTAVSQQQNTDCKLVLNPINVTSQVLNSNDSKPNILSTPVSNIQQLNTNFLQIPITQKPGSILTRANLQPSTETNNINNIRIGQKHPTIRSVILPANYRTAMVSSPQRGVDYRLILKPVNIQSPQTNILKNMPPSRFPRNPSIRNATLRPTASSSTRPISLPIRVPVTRLPMAKPQNEVIADSKIEPIPLGERKNQLVISKKSIQICIDEINKKNPTTDHQPYLKINEPAIETIQAEVTYRLFYLLRECKKVLLRSRSTVLTEESVRQVCAEYFETFYGNKLWPLFCLKPNSGDSTGEDRVWMRKHNNVNLIGWLKHPRFRNPSYIKKRHRHRSKKTKLALSKLMKVSEVVYEGVQPTETNQQTEESSTSRIFFQSLKKNQVPFSTILPEHVARERCDGLLFKQTLNSFMNTSQTSQIPSINQQKPTTNVKIKLEPS